MVLIWLSHFCLLTNVHPASSILHDLSAPDEPLWGQTSPNGAWRALTCSLRLCDWIMSGGGGVMGWRVVGCYVIWQDYIRRSALCRRLSCLTKLSGSDPKHLPDMTLNIDMWVSTDGMCDRVRCVCVHLYWIIIIILYTYDITRRFFYS